MNAVTDEDVEKMVIIAARQIHCYQDDEPFDQNKHTIALMAADNVLNALYEAGIVFMKVDGKPIT